jgi:hypothetical protein
MPSAFASGFLNTLKPYTCPMHMCTAMAAGGTSQRLNPGWATVASRERKLMVGWSNGCAVGFSGLAGGVARKD